MSESNPDSYALRKQQFDNMITLYGRQVVHELLREPGVEIFRVHLADSNRAGGIISEIEALARERQVEIIYHSRQALSRISRNGRQDQGVAIDIQTNRYRSVDDVDSAAGDLMALDRVTNPQNLGMIIRTVAASPLAGLVLPRKGSAKIDPLVHKASSGTLIHADLYHCADIGEGLKKLRNKGFEIIGLAGDGSRTINSMGEAVHPRVFVLGNETEGLSDETRRICDQLISIPLARNVESINVAAAAALVAFRSILRED